MDYMFLIYSEPMDPAAQRSPEERRHAMNVHWSVMDDAAARGVFRGASPLMPARTAVTVRRQNGAVIATDGPFAETREVLGGYYVIDCRDEEEARYWAERLTEASCALSVEYRALAPIPARVEPSAHA
jgi:hypothetical protein